MSHSHNGKISTSNNSGNSLNPTAPASPIIKKGHEPFFVGKLVTSHNFFTLCLYMKETLWDSGITFDLVASA